MVRKQPEISRFTLGMRMARSARLWVKGTRKSVTQRGIAPARPPIRLMRSNAADCLPRTRHLTSRLETGPTCW